MLKGLRVVRSTVGTLVGTLEKLPTSEGKQVGVYLDVGRSDEFAITEDGLYPLLVFDSGPAGICHSLNCRACSTQIFGMRWACAECESVDLCTVCYMRNEDVRTSFHADGLAHKFRRIDCPFAASVAVSPRLGSRQVKAVGFGPGADVAPREKLSDGTSLYGKIVRAGGVRGQSDRSVAQVQWTTVADGAASTSGDQFLHRYSIGHEGVVALKAIREALVWPYYPDHLPRLGSMNFLPFDAILSNCLCTAHLATVLDRPEFVEGDIVRIVAPTLKGFYDIQVHLDDWGWQTKLEQCFIEADFGIVRGKTRTNGVCVQFRSELGLLVLHPYVLERVEAPMPMQTPFELRPRKVIYLGDRLTLIACPRTIEFIQTKQNGALTAEHLEAAGKKVIVRLICKVSKELMIEICDDPEKRLLLVFLECIEGMPNELGLHPVNSTSASSIEETVSIEYYDSDDNAMSVLPQQANPEQTHYLQSTSSQVAFASRPMVSAAQDRLSTVTTRSVNHSDTASPSSTLLSYLNGLLLPSRAIGAQSEALFARPNQRPQPSEMPLASVNVAHSCGQSVLVSPSRAARAVESAAFPPGNSCQAACNDVDKCVLCNDLDAIVQFKPCGHTFLCGKCALNFKGNRCIAPGCRATIGWKFDSVTLREYDSANYEEVQDEMLCRICQERKIDRVYDCGHHSCSACLARMEPKICHSCRRPITRVNPFY